MKYIYFAEQFKMSHFKSQKSWIIVQWAQNVDLHYCTNTFLKVQSMVMKPFIYFLVWFKLLFWLISGLNKPMLTLCWLWTCVTSLSASWLLNPILWEWVAFYVQKSPVCTESIPCVHPHTQCIPCLPDFWGLQLLQSYELREKPCCFPLQLDYSASYYLYFLANGREKPI